MDANFFVLVVEAHNGAKLRSNAQSASYQEYGYGFKPLTFASIF